MAQKLDNLPVSMQNWKYQLIRFMAVGLLCTSIHYVIFLALTYLLHIHYLLAGGLAYIIAFSVNFTLNSRWTFAAYTSDTSRWKILLPYILVNGLSLLLNLLALHLFVDVFGIPAWMSNLMAIGVSTVSNFTGLKFFVFKNKPSIGPIV